MRGGDRARERRDGITRAVIVWNLHLLGGFTFETSGTPVSVSESLQRLLAFLALRGPSHRNLVAGTLWPRVADEQALASLRTSVWRLNKQAPGALRPDGSILALADNTWVDSSRQEALAASLLSDRVDDVEWLIARLDRLWPGELLPGWYDDWVMVERDRLTQLRLHALEASARRLSRARRTDIAVQLALEAVRGEPLRESATATLMSVYIAEGNVSDAVRLYDAFRKLLLRELGVEPSPGLKDLLPPCRAVSSL
jgi:DNA-binding SARP family transcriptional activator